MNLYLKLLEASKRVLAEDTTPDDIKHLREVVAECEATVPKIIVIHTPPGHVGRALKEFLSMQHTTLFMVDPDTPTAKQMAESLKEAMPIRATMASDEPILTKGGYDKQQFKHRQRNHKNKL